MLRVRDIATLVEKLAPQALAASWDSVGLQVGNLNRPVKKIYIALDPSYAVIRRAIANRCDLLLAHHPLSLSLPPELDVAYGVGKSIALALAHDLSIYAAHTNLDAASSGLNDRLCELLTLKDCESLVPLSVPLSDPLLGLGRIGTLPAPETLKTYCHTLKRRFKIKHFRLIAPPSALGRRMRRIAVCSGSGASFIAAAAAKGVDLYVTGDIKYHDALSALDLGLPIADLGHFATEHWVIDLLAQIVQGGLSGSPRRKIVILKDHVSRDPFIFV